MTPFMPDIYVGFLNRMGDLCAVNLVCLQQGAPLINRVGHCISRLSRSAFSS